MDGEHGYTIQGESRPDPEIGRWKVEFARVDPGEPLVFVCLANDIWGWNTHWDGRRTIPCPAVKAELCCCNKRLDWKCWIPILEKRSRMVRMLELPRSAVVHIDSQMQAHGALYGWECRVARIGKEKNSKVHLCFTRQVTFDLHGQSVPSARDYMHQIWRIPLQPLGAGIETGVNSRLSGSILSSIHGKNGNGTH